MLERRDDIDALFADVDMPSPMSGVILAGRIGERWPHRLVISSGPFSPGSRDMSEAGRFPTRPYSTIQVFSAFGDAA